MRNLQTENRVLYKGKKLSAGMNESGHRGGMQMKRSAQEHRGGEHRLNTGPPERLTVK
ncbi:TPA: protein DraP [Escherichia coli]